MYIPKPMLKNNAFPIWVILVVAIVTFVIWLRSNFEDLAIRKLFAEKRIRDYVGVSSSDFIDGTFPKSRSDESPTLYALRILRQNFDSNLMGGFIKWGPVYVQDFVAFKFARDCGLISKDHRTIQKLVYQALIRVDWTFLEELLEETSDLFGHALSLQQRDEFCVVIQHMNYMNGNPGEFYKSFGLEPRSPAKLS